jgi:hypothetical protein
MWGGERKMRGDLEFIGENYLKVETVMQNLKPET